MSENISSSVTMIGGSGDLLETTEALLDGQNSERRIEIRYEVQEPCSIHRVLPNGDIELTSQSDALIWDVSRKGIGLQTQSKLFQTGSSLLINCDINGRNCFQCVSIVQAKEADGGMTRLNGIFGGPLGVVFENDMLVPRLSPDSLRFEVGVDDAQLASLVSLKALKPMSLDFVRLCPKCQAIPTFRQGCGRCLSGHVSHARMIHHYACANVDFAENFEFDGQLACPKCRAKKLIVGADFEYLNGPTQCEDCHQSNLELTNIGHCMGCNYRFPMHMAETMEITGYRVARMDILDLINTA